MPIHPSCLKRNRNFENIEKFLANRLVSSANDEDSVRKLTTQTKEEIQCTMKLDSRMEIAESILRNLVPKFGDD